jgi:benzoyl-CoA reductase/2-hydroxyglutaryl-CoA dehydratase subunit BcrC/BadD/HgdB
MQLRANAALKALMREYFQDLGAEDPARPVAWCTSVGPAELLRAYGCRVYFPENHGALLGVTRTAGACIPHATAAGYSARICSYLSSDIGSHLRGRTPLAEAYGLAAPPRPDLLVASDNQCREVEEWFGYYARHYNAPLVVARVPKFLDRIEGHALDYLTSEMEQVAERIGRALGRALDHGRLAETLACSARATALWKEALACARHRPAPLTFFDGTVQMGPIVVLRGTAACEDYYRLLLAELRQCLDEGRGALPAERLRLYWDGMPVWGRLRALSELFASLETAVVASTYCNSWVFDAFDAAEPLRSTARAYAEIFINRSEAWKEEYLERACADFQVDGLVYHDALTCPHNSNSRFGLPERVKRRTGLPYIVLDGDLNDLRCYSDEQSVIKIETFIEQLKQ